MDPLEKKNDKGRQHPAATPGQPATTGATTRTGFFSTSLFICLMLALLAYLAIAFRYAFGIGFPYRSVYFYINFIIPLLILVSLTALCLTRKITNIIAKAYQIIFASYSGFMIAGQYVISTKSIQSCLEVLNKNQYFMSSRDSIKLKSVIIFSIIWLLIPVIFIGCSRFLSLYSKKIINPWKIFIVFILSTVPGIIYGIRYRKILLDSLEAASLIICIYIIGASVFIFFFSIFKKREFLALASTPPRQYCEFPNELALVTACIIFIASIVNIFLGFNGAASLICLVLCGIFVLAYFFLPRAATASQAPKMSGTASLSSATSGGSMSGPRPGNGLAIASLVLGILALVFTLFGIGAFIGLIMSVIGAVLGIMAVNRLPRRARGMAVAGLVCSLVVLALAILMLLVIGGSLGGLFIWLYNATL